MKYRKLSSNIALLCASMKAYMLFLLGVYEIEHKYIFNCVRYVLLQSYYLTEGLHHKISFHSMLCFNHL